MNRKELKCPKCGTMFTVDEAEYASIVEQVKNAEFAIELDKRMEEMKKLMQAEETAKAVQESQRFEQKLGEKDLTISEKNAEIEGLRSQIKGFEETKKAEIEAECAKKDAAIATLQAQLSKSEGAKDIAVIKAKEESQEMLQKKELEIVTLQNQIAQADKRMEEMKKLMQAEETAKAVQESQHFEQKLGEKDLTISEKNAEIEGLKSQIKGYEETKKAEIEAECAKKDATIATLQAQLSKSKGATEVAVMEAKVEANKQLQENALKIQALQNQIAQAGKEAQIILNTKKEEYENNIKMKDKEIENLRYRFLTNGTKEIGEDLEQWCQNQFTKVRALSYPDAYFEKDNDASKGSKGDFIFRDCVDGIEYISIMFEMKNEADKTLTKHKNEDFFAKLDKDRQEKGCEYAVLVSMLERDSELYNEGIVDVSYRYPKMFVVRPRFFMSIIALLSKASLNSVSLKRDLVIARRQTVDVTNFESNLNNFKTKFCEHYKWATDRFHDAIKEIDKSIKSLQEVKNQLLTAGKQLKWANDNTQSLDIIKLTKDNPTMKRLFDEAREAQGEPDDVGFAEEITDSEEDDELEGLNYADEGSEDESGDIDIKDID